MLRLTIVGEGILPTRDLSLGGLSRIREAELVVHTATWPGIGRWLDGLGVRKRRDLSDMYVEHEVDEVNYDRIVRWVLSLVKEHGDVVYLVPGTPSLGVSSTTRLLELARAEAGMECAVIPSVSSFDSVAMDLGVDFLDRGTIVVDANRLLIYRLRIDPTMGLLLYHPASVGSVRVDFRAPWTSNRMELLRDYLLGFYPSEHPCFAVLSQSEPSATPRISRGQLAHLAEDVASYAYGTSMYVPPVEAFSFDEALVRQMLKVESQSRRLASGDVPL